MTEAVQIWYILTALDFLKNETTNKQILILYFNLLF